MPTLMAPWIYTEFLLIPGPVRLIAGGADGADTLAELIGRHQMGWTVEVERADWKNSGRAAGPERNQLMLAKWRPSLALFFHCNPTLGTGTLDMYKRCCRAGVETKVVIYSRP